MTISEADFAAMFPDEPAGAGRNQRLVDAVMGIFQRAELDADLDRIAVEQGSGSPMSFLMIDLDHFKSFNDAYGHGVGDEVLKVVAQTVAMAVRGKGEAYRYGGEEISVILPNHVLGEASVVAERIRTEIESARVESIPDACVTASIGVAAIPQTSANKDDMLTDADRALYQAKDNGRNRVCCATKAASGTPVQRKTPARLDDDLQESIPKADAFEIIFDPENPGRQFWSLRTIEGFSSQTHGIEYRVKIRNTTKRTLYQVKATTETLGPLGAQKPQTSLIFDRTGQDTFTLDPGATVFVKLFFTPLPLIQPGTLMGSSTAAYGPLRVTVSALDTGAVERVFQFNPLRMDFDALKESLIY